MPREAVRDIDVELDGHEGDVRQQPRNLAEWVARIMDELIVIPGTGIRIGLDPILGLLPVGGDGAASLASIVVLLQAAAAGVPRVVLARMGTNIAINALVGAVPVVGDAFSIWFRSNSRNRELMSRHRGGVPGSRTDKLYVGVIVAAVIAVVLGSLAAGIFLMIALLKGLGQMVG